MSSHEQAPQPSEDRVTLALTPHVRQALQHLAEFPLLDAIFGRRSRRFPLGGEIPDGVLAYRSRHAPLPLTELERLLQRSRCSPSASSGLAACTTRTRRAPGRTAHAFGPQRRRTPRL